MKPQRIYIVSDWHLGGTPDGDHAKSLGGYGTQICRSGAAIAEFIDWIVRRAADQGELIELIINGDMVDFLAPEPGWVPCEWIADESKAAARLEEIVANSRLSGRSPFDALRDLLGKEHTLTLLLGNHDVELSLPRVRQKLVELLGAEGRKFTFIYDGEACVRGQLLVEHGNRYDSFNALDYSALRQERSHISRGLAVDEKQRKQKFFLPPAGTLIVVHGINGLLRTHAYLNLLKPETKAALPLLLALRPEIEPVLKVLVKQWKIRRRKKKAALESPAMPSNAGYLSASDSSFDATYQSLEQLLREMVTEQEYAQLEVQNEQVKGALASPVDSNLPLLERVRAMFAKTESKIDTKIMLSELILEGDSSRRQTLIRAAFRKLQSDTSFDLEVELPEYLEAARELLANGRFSHIVFGHTHLPKQISIEREPDSPGIYLNCGTWADVIALPHELSSADESAELALKKFVVDLSERRLSPHLRRFLSYVEATIAECGKVEANLYSYCGSGAEQKPPLTEIAK
jgi:UDP-2,3-diacylglucosamine pyrophosphatase LpxH